MKFISNISKIVTTALLGHLIPFISACSLIYDDQIQIKLLEYVRTTMLFSNKNVNPDLISWNR